MRSVIKIREVSNAVMQCKYNFFECFLRIVKDNVKGKIKYWAGLPSCGQAGLLYCGQESRKLPFQVRQQPNIYFLHKILTQLAKSTGLK